MKQLSKLTIDRDGSGEVSLMPEDDEDLWHLYNIMGIGDYLTTTTIRKVVTESAGGTPNAVRRHILVKLKIDSINYDVTGGQLRVKGTNELESEFIRRGASHTVEVEVNRKLTLGKDNWDTLHVERVMEACDESARVDTAAVIMQEGIAHVCLIKPNITIVLQKIETSIPRKRKGNAAQHDAGLKRFYESVAQAMLKHLRWEVLKVIIVASPGYVKDDFLAFAATESQKHADWKPLMEHKGKFLPCHSSSGFKHSLKEVMLDPAVAPKLAETKAMAEVKALEDFYAMLSSQPDRATYGPVPVIAAAEKDAIETLLISDGLLRSADLIARKKYVALVERVRETNGRVHIFSSLHVTGEQLGKLTGVAATLRFPCEDPEQSDSDSDD